MRVTFLTHYFPPEVGAPQARIAALARRLADRGVEVTIHTGFPTYPDGEVKAPYRNRPFLWERQGPVVVARSLVYPAANTGFAKRLTNHLAFAVSSVLTAPGAPGADVVVAETPPLFTAAAGLAYARLKRAPLVLNVADRWPESAVQLGMLRDPRMIAAATTLERHCYRAAAAITVPTEGLRTALEDVPEAAGRVTRVGPAVDLERFRPTAPEPSSPPLKVLYAGTVGLAQGTSTLIEAARRAGPEVVEVAIAGGGAEERQVSDLVRRTRAENVRLLGQVPAEEIPQLLTEAHAAAVLLRDRPVFEGALPTKTIEAMAAGRPVVLSAKGEAAALVESSGSGLVVPPEDPAALAAAFARLAGDAELRRRLGEAGRACAEERFGWETTAAAWERILASCARRGR